MTCKHINECTRKLCIGDVRDLCVNGHGYLQVNCWQKHHYRKESVWRYPRHWIGRIETPVGEVPLAELHTEITKIRKVKVLRGKAKVEAEKQGLNPDDLVIMYNDHIEKIEGDPVSYLLKRIFKPTLNPKCSKCLLFKIILLAVKSNRGYWLATELFVELHDGKDYCDEK